MGDSRIPITIDEHDGGLVEMGASHEYFHRHYHFYFCPICGRELVEGEGDELVRVIERKLTNGHIEIGAFVPYRSEHQISGEVIALGEGKEVVKESRLLVREEVEESVTCEIIKRLKSRAVGRAYGMPVALSKFMEDGESLILMSYRDFVKLKNKDFQV